MDRIALTFLHPRNSDDEFRMSVAPQATGRQVVSRLLEGDEDGPWLDPEPPGRPYELVVSRTQRAIAPAETIGAAGAVAGDIISVMHPGQAA